MGLLNAVVLLDRLRTRFSFRLSGIRTHKTKDDGTSALDENDEFVTHVFHRKGRTARKWIIL